MDDLHFSTFVLHRRTRRLTCASKAVQIGSRALDLLELLVVNNDRVVSRDEIMAGIWPATVVGDNKLNVQVANLRRVLGDATIFTVPGRGLRFALDVRPGPPRAPQLPVRPSVVVLPFSTFAGSHDLDWLADGFVDDITTKLSRFRDLFVVARNSAFVYREMPRDLRGIARDLGVRYVVEGSVRATNSRVRVTAQLIDATDGSHVWTENFDSDMAGHFETQATVARAVVTCIAPQIARAEAARIRVLRPEDLTAYGLVQRGWAVISSGEMSYDSGQRDQAGALARTALERDPGSGLALRVLAWVA